MIGIPPEDGRAVDIGRPLAAVTVHCRLQFLYYAQVRPVYDVALTLLPTRQNEQQVRNQYRTRREVQVTVVLICVIRRSKDQLDAEELAGIQLQDALCVIPASDAAVGSYRVDQGVGAVPVISGQPRAALPDPPLYTVRRRAKRGDLPQRFGVVREHPPVVIEFGLAIQ